MDTLPAVTTDHLDAIRELCVKYRVKRLAVFGSAAKGTFDPAKSDVDFVVEFSAGEQAGVGGVLHVSGQTSTAPGPRCRLGRTEGDQESVFLESSRVE